MDKIKMKAIICLHVLLAVVYGFPDRKVLQNAYRYIEKHESKDLSATKDLLLQTVDSVISEPSKLVDQALFEQPLDNDLDMKNGTCACVGYNCGCCIHAEWDEIDLNSTVCANFSYLPAPDYGISMTLTLDGDTLFNETVSARSPPPVCVGVPYLKKFASVCLKFHNLTVSNYSLSGCVDFQAHLEGFNIKDFPIGCFKIPPGGVGVGQGNNNGRFTMLRKNASHDMINQKLYFESQKEVIVKN